MRLLRLYLKAFGPFTNAVLDFSSAEGRGLHVVFGPNEAGKSTSLRAVKGLLFGIPATTTDDSRHPASKLRVGAELVTANGKLTLFRSRKRTNSLADEHGEPVSEEVLRTLLGGLDESSFSRRIGLDQDELDSGAEALLAGSEEGLFAAGTGGAEVRAYLDELRKRSEYLYKRQGKNPALNRAIQRYGEAKATLQKNVRAPEHYEVQRRQLEVTERERSACEEERRRLRDEQREGNRLLALLPKLAAYRDEASALAALGTFVLLPEGAAQDRESIESELRELNVVRRETEREIERSLAALAALPEAFPLESAKDRLPELESRLGSERKAMLDLPKLRARLGALEAEIVEILRGLGLSAEEEDVLAEAARRIPPEHEVLGVRAVRAELTQREASLAALEDALEDVPRGGAPENPPSEEGLAALAGLVAEGRAAAPVVERYRERHQSLRVLDTQVSALGRKLASGDPSSVDTSRLDELTRLVEEAEREAKRIDGELASSRTLAESNEARLAQIERELDSKAATRELPREADLRVLRERRDADLLRALRGEGAEADAWRSLVLADETVDRMRRAAEELSRVERIEREGAALLGVREREAERIARLLEERARLEAALRQAFLARGVRFEGGVAGRLVDELGRLEELRRSRAEVDAEASVMRDGLEALEARMRSFGARYVGAVELRLTGWLELLERELAERRAERERWVDGERRRAVEEARRGVAEQRAEEARVTILSLRRELDARLSRLGLRSDLRDAELEAVLAGFSELERKLHEARELRKRVEGIERDTSILAEYLDSLASPVDKALSLLERGEAFIVRIRTEVAQAEERRRLERELGGRREQRSALSAKVELLEGRLEELKVRARVGSPEELALAERRSEEFRRRTTTMERLRGEVVRESGGEAFETLLERSKSVTPAMLSSRLDGIGDELERLEARIRELEADVGGLATALERYKTVDVADARQLVEMRAAEARALTRDYVRGEIQRRVLSQQMERFAQSFAGPLIERSGEIFSALTLGAYRGVRVEERMLRCMRGGEDVDVAQLSRGTRAQLYFALRIASLEKYFAVHPKVPLVLDDLFVDFDDDRATVAFEVLAGLARETQILYFTHLSRDVELAESASPGVFVHRLGVS